MEANDEERVKLLNRLCEIMYLENPVGLLIWNDKTPFGHDSRVLNFEDNVNIMGCIDYKDLQIAA